MSTIRRQSLISSVIVYSGFALGAINTLLITREKGGFAESQYGLLGIFLAIGTIIFSISNLGTQSVIYKFYPYYKDNLPTENIDLMSWAFLLSSIGFSGVMIAGYVFKDLVIRKFGAESPDLVRYYFWIFPFGFGLTIFMLLEAYGWQLKLSVLTNFLREVLFRVFTSILILLSYAGFLKSFDVFIKIYAFSYVFLALILALILLKRGQLHFTLTPSRVTKKFFKKMKAMALLVWSGGLVFNISFFFAQIVIASVVPGGLTFVGVYQLAQYVASIIQAPQRGIISASVGPLSRAWKDKDYGKIKRIYQRSSINQLIFSIGIFTLLWINFKDGVYTFHLKEKYLLSQQVFLFIGLTRIVDMGTGVNSQIIGTSTFWRFDFISGALLLLITLPLNYYLAKEMGVTGPAVADLITFFIYNAIRWFFLYRKFNMQPFTIKSLYTILLGGAGYLACDWLCGGMHGFAGLFTRSLLFLAIFGGGVLGLRLSEDVRPIWETLKKRLGISK